MRVFSIIMVIFWGLIIPSAAAAEAKIHRYTFTISVGMWEILPDVKVKSLLVNGQIPGPAIEATQGDIIEVKVINNTQLPHTIHWHGLEIDNSQDGVPYVTQDPIKKGESFTYRFRAYPAGTRFWHCHWSTLLHISGGMYGPFIIHPKDQDQDLNSRYNVTQDHTLMIDSIDPAWQEQMINMMEKMHSQSDISPDHKTSESIHTDIGLGMSGMAHKEKLFHSPAEYIKAVKQQGYRSPYLKPLPKPEYRYHLINGHPYPLTPSLRAKVNEAVRLRLINAGNIPHYLHVHGMQILVVAIDGNTLEHPYLINTVPCVPGQAVDIILRPSIPGWWAVHDHAEWGSTNNGHFPGGTMFMIGVADDKGQISPYTPKIILSQ